MGVVVTRPAHQNRRLLELLSEAGAEPIALPVLKIDELELSDPIRDAVAGVVDHDWLLFTSANAVEVFARRLHDFYDPVLTKSGEADRIPGLFAELAARTKVGAVGGATRSALEAHGVGVELVAGEGSGEALAEALGPAPGPASVLLPRSDVADDDLVRRLKAKGWSPLPVSLYGPRPADPPVEALERVRRGDYDAITFASGSAVRAFVEKVGSPGGLGLSDPDGRRKMIVCIGPKTARAARDVGFEVGAVADEASDAGIVRAIEGLRS